MSGSYNSRGDGAWFPVVGIGASAGGLGAFEKFFAAMPAVEAEDGMEVQPNRLYVIPANTYLSISDSTLQLSEPKLHRGCACRSSRCRRC